MSKYHNRKTVVDGQAFDSIREAQRWQELRLLERGGDIRNLRRQVPFELLPQCKVCGKTLRKKSYIADFVYLNERGCQVVEDVKGYRTQVYELKRHMMMWLYGIEVVEV